MKVLIVGLGLMGGAYAYRLSNKGYTVYGSDLDLNAIDYALDKKFIENGSVNPKEFIITSDVIVLAIYPEAILTFMNSYKEYFHEGQVITDICGVKSDFIFDAISLAKPATYLSHHPMAGREKSGIYYSTECVFGGANFLITPTKDVLASPSKKEENAINILKQLGTDLGFTHISVMDIEKHNRMIGFTSQLTHAIAVSLVNSDHDDDTKYYIGDSYRDLTRIAMINDKLWSELFLENRAYLLEHIASFEMELNLLKMALYKEDKEALCKLFKSSTRIRKEMEKK